ncbi:hypothetical protein KVR01_000742 [Diaporthe batatas]|uniref:uncharacterized protein n=1 Tax=Diaporthe batatas TaxID=748121 RepID=UPI001D045F44|nr:uncharacterized protein KVR01_000742 [Diaporthe batatas]KAG8169997.1 hypothetical protein KVR01_000742 [Diaporthe batatas]
MPPSRNRRMVQDGTSHASELKAQSTRAYQVPKRGVLSRLPVSWVPYAELSRIEKPGGLYGVYMAYLLGLGYGGSVFSPTLSPGTLAYSAAILLVYCVFHRGAACTANDIMDREFDREVARCRNRPVARGALTPGQAWLWYFVQVLGTASTIACLPSPMLALIYAIPIQILGSIYPLSKRLTDFPQLILGLPIAGGILMAAASVGLKPLDTSSLAIVGATASLTASHYIWTVIFDYVNACQDTSDDIRAGVRSMAVRYHDTDAFITTLGTAQVACLLLTGILAGFSLAYFVLAVGGNAICLMAMVKTVSRSRSDICGWWFAWGGLLVSGTTAMGLLAEYYCRFCDENCA